jgi:hypothetical protein
MDVDMDMLNLTVSRRAVSAYMSARRPNIYAELSLRVCLYFRASSTVTHSGFLNLIPQVL